MGDPVRGGTGGTKTESFCLNCHSGDELALISELPPSPPLTCSELPFELPFEVPSACEAPCPAHPSWPPELKELQKNLFQLPFWVRSNFERARHGAPFRIDVDKAGLEIDLKPNSFVSQVGVNGRFFSLEVLASPDARIHSQWGLQDGQLIVGARNLLEVDGVEVSGPLGTKDKPLKILRNAQGEIHALHQTQGTLGFLDWLQDSLGGESLDDYKLNDFIPRDFKDPADPKGEAVPEKYVLQDLLDRVFDLLQAGKSAKKSKWDLGGLLSPYFLKPGSHITLSIDDLKDFFLPGILDLGPSHGKLSLQVDKDHNLTLTLEDLDLRLEPMDYPLAKDGQRTGLKLRSGRIQAGPSVEVAHQGILRPGVHLVRSTTTENVEMKVNLGVDLELEDGSRLHTHALLDGVLIKTPNGYQLAPDFYISLRDTALTDAKGRPLLNEGRLEISSEAYPIEIPDQPFVEYVGNGAHLLFEGRVKEGDEFKVQGFSPIPQNEFGAVAWKNILQGLDLMAQVDYLPAKDKKADLQTQLHFFAEPARQECREGEEVYSFGIEAETDSRGIQDQTATPLLEGLLGHLEIFLDDHQGYRGALDLRAQGLNFPEAMKKGLSFKNPSLQIEVDQVRFSKDFWSATFPKWRVAVALNTDPPKKGLIQGQFSVAQREGKPFTVEWRPGERQLAIQDLDWGIQVEKLLPAAGGLPKGQTLGADGRLQIDYVLNAQGEMKRWNGDGRILILGDEDGEVYLVNRHGTRVGPPLFRRTHWKFGKLHRIDVVGHYPYVETKLKTYLNFSSLAPKEKGLEQELQDAGFGQRWYQRFEKSNKPGQPWESSETLFELGYDNQPFSPQGFDRLNFKYFLDLYMKSQAKKLFQGVTP